MPTFDSDRYFLAPAIQQSFLDKDTGELLAGGKVYFKRDDDHDVDLDVFYLTGVHGSYSVVAFPNPIILSSIGTVVDPSNSPKEIYYHPYDDDDTVINYYIEVYNSDDEFQFSIDNFPGIGQGGGDTDEATHNYIGNGQFRLHNNIIDPDADNVGLISDSDTVIAPGGHHFVTDASSGQRYVTFSRDPTRDLDGYPRYVGRFRQTGSGLSASRCDYVFRFKNVDTFASTDQQYTLKFTAKTETGQQDIKFMWYKYYGTGGSGFDALTSTQEKINDSWATHSYTFAPFGLNDAASIGDDDDDYIEIGVRFPLDSAYDIYLTDILLTKGDDTSLTYPYTSGQEDNWRALAGGMKYENYDLDIYSANFGSLTQENYDGSLIGLPVFYGQDGLQADTSSVGEVKALSFDLSDFSETPYVYANGQKLERTGKNGLRIPYGRLWYKYWNQTIKLPIYGTGADYVSALVPNSDEFIVLSNNLYGSASLGTASDASFTISEIHAATSAGFNIRSYNDPTLATEFLIEHKFPHYNASGHFLDIANAAAGTSGFTLEIIRSSTRSAAASNAASNGYPRGLFKLTALAASALTGATGKYFTFSSSNGTNPSSTTTNYYVWYQITTEADPSPGGTPIKVNLEASDSAIVVAKKTIAALQGGQVTLIECSAASGTTDSSYVTFVGAGNTNYYFWISKDGGGTEPVVSGTGVEVIIATGDSAPDVADKVRTAINKKFFAVPDYRGMFLRGFDDGRGLDLGAADRYSITPYYGGDEVGTSQIDDILIHVHAQEWSVESLSKSSTDVPAYKEEPGNMPYGGGAESRPYNISVQYVIRL